MDHIPLSGIEEGDMRCFLQKLDSVEKKIDDLGKHTILPQPHINNGHTQNTPRFTDRTKISTNTGLSKPTWADITATPHDVQHRHITKPAGTDTDTDYLNDDNMEGDDGFTVVQEKKRRRVRSPNNVNLNISSSQNARPSTKPKPRTIVGNNSSCLLKAAKILTKNRIFCVSNVAAETSCDDLKTWIESCNIKVNNIYTAKTKYEGSTSFRVNINAADVEKFVSDEIWASHMIVREWVFKKTENQNQHQNV